MGNQIWGPAKISWILGTTAALQNLLQNREKTSKIRYSTPLVLKSSWPRLTLVKMADLSICKAVLYVQEASQEGSQANF